MEKGKLNIDEIESINKLNYILKEYPVVRKAYKIFFRGKNFDFESFRDYSQDDDASNIDWIASSRANKLLVRQYKEQENLTVIFLIDVSENMVLGSGEKLKCEYAAELALALAYIILNGNNRVGYILFSDKVNVFYPPKRGKRCFYSLRDALLNPDNYKGGSNISDAIDYLFSLPPYAAGSVIMISDFAKFDEKAGRQLPLVSSIFESIALMVRDKIDLSLPDVSGEFVIEDSGSGEQMVLDPVLAKKSYETYVQEHDNFVRAAFKKGNVDLIDFMTGEESIDRLAAFLKERAIMRSARK